MSSSRTAAEASRVCHTLHAKAASGLSVPALLALGRFKSAFPNRVAGPSHYRALSHTGPRPRNSYLKVAQFSTTSRRGNVDQDASEAIASNSTETNGDKGPTKLREADRTTSPTTLFIRDLPPGTTEEDVRAAVGQYADTAGGMTIRMETNVYVAFARGVDTRDIFSAHRKEPFKILSQNVKLQHANLATMPKDLRQLTKVSAPTTAFVVAGPALQSGVTAKEVRQLFEPFGTLRFIRSAAPRSASPDPPLWLFNFVSPESIEKLMEAQEAKRFTLNGKPLQVRYRRAREPLQNVPSTCLIFRGIRRSDEEYVRAYLSEYTPSITEVFINPKEPNVHVHFDTIQHATEAKKGLTGVETDDGFIPEVHYASKIDKGWQPGDSDPIIDLEPSSSTEASSTDTTSEPKI